MPEKLICPSCKKDSYSASPETYNPCPHCNFVFNNSTSLGPEIRSEHRFNWSTYCKVFSENLPGENLIMVAKTIDVSPQGAKLRYIGEPLKIGSRVDINIIDLEIHQRAAVVWSIGSEKSDILSGLKFLEPAALKFLSHEGHVIPLSLFPYILL